MMVVFFKGIEKYIFLFYYGLRISIENEDLHGTAFHTYPTASDFSSRDLNQHTSLPSPCCFQKQQLSMP